MAGQMELCERFLSEQSRIGLGFCIPHSWMYHLKKCPKNAFALILSHVSSKEHKFTPWNHFSRVKTKINEK